MMSATMNNPFSHPTSTDSAIDLSDAKDTQIPSIEKEVLIPSNDTDKQAFNRSADSAKEVLSIQTEILPPLPFQSTGIESFRHHQSSSDTDKIFVPQIPPTSSDKEVSMPSSNTDKQLSSMEGQNLFSASTTNTPITPTHHFRIEKSSPLGLIMPQNQTLLVRSLNPTTKFDQGPAFKTSEMDYMDVMAVNPPPFELFTAHDFTRSELVARFVLRSWQGLTGMKGEFEVSCQGDRQKWEVVRKGLTSRTYRLNKITPTQQTGSGNGLVWKGSTKAVRGLVGDEQKNKGNLKLCTADGEVLAVWQQWRDSGTLGDLMLFERARGIVGVEVVVTSCIAVVSAERASGANWIGGLGKG